MQSFLTDLFSIMLSRLAYVITHTCQHLFYYQIFQFVRYSTSHFSVHLHLVGI